MKKGYILIVIIMQFLFLQAFSFEQYESDLIFQKSNYNGYDIPLIIKVFNGKSEILGLRLPFLDSDSTHVIQNQEIKDIYNQPYLLLFNQKLLTAIIDDDSYKKGIWNEPDIEIKLSNKKNIKKEDLLLFFSNLNQNSLCNLTNNDKRYLHMELINNNESILIKMPKELKYLIDKDKKELGYYYLDKLDKSPLIAQKKNNFSDWEKIAIKNPEMLVYEKQSNHDGFVKKVFCVLENDSISVVWDRRYPAESLQNLFLADINKEGFSIDIQLLLYDDQEQRRSFTLQEFLDKMLLYCELSVLVETVQDDQISFSLLFDDESLDRAHLLFTTIAVDDLFDQNNTWQAKMILAIPRDNSIQIKNFEGEYKNKFNLK